MCNVLKIICAFYFLLNFLTSAQLTQFIYNDFSTSANTITLKDSAIFVNHNKFIRLTNTTQRVMGHAFYSTPVMFKTSPNGSVLPFSTTFTFGTVPEFQKLGGHGMAFVISPTKDLSKKALPSQYLGLFSAADMGNLTNHVFAVELDTVQDFEFGDINDNHIGIDLNSLVSNASVTAAYALENSTMVNVTMKDGQTIQTWIDYDPATHLINVTISLSTTKPRKPLISYKYDLSQIFEENMYVGFAGSTGLLASSHYVLGWSFNMSGPAVSLSMPPLPIPPNANNKRKEVLAVSLSTSLAVFFVLVVLVAIYIAFRIKDRDIIEEWELTIGPHRYPYHELRKATKGRHWPTNKDFLVRFGSVLPAEDDLHCQAAECILLAKFRMFNDIETGCVNIELNQVSMQLEDIEGSHVNGRNSLLVLKNALSCKRSRNYSEALECCNLYNRVRSELKEEKLRNESRTDRLCIVSGIAAVVAFWFCFL